MALKNLPCELYLHNLMGPNDIEWNLILYVGAVKGNNVMDAKLNK